MHEKCKWKAAILILVAVGLLKEFRPSGPFLVDYAVDHKLFTAEQMTHEVLPATTGSYIVSLVLLLMVTDVLCYKPIIVQGGVYTVLTWVVTIWFFDSINAARLRQIFYGISVTATEVAYFTYMYANIEKKDYKKVTSYTHSAIHFGQFLSGVVGQLLLSFNILNFEELNYLSLGGAIAALAFSLFLPRVLRESETDEAKQEEGLMTTPENNKDAEKGGTPSPPPGLDYTRNVGKEKPGFIQRWREAPTHWMNNIRYTYTNRDIIKWSVWWAMAYGLYIQVDLYIESLWKEIEHHSHQNVYNGAVHASHAIISVVLGLIVGRTKMCWIRWGCTIFGLGTVLQGVALFLMSKTHDLYVAYGAFILFQTMFQVLVIISKSQVAESIREKSEAFIFGMNTLAACIIHLALTLAVSSNHGFKLPIREQYLVYGVYSILLGVGFFFCDMPRKCARARSWTVDVRDSVRQKRRVQEGNKDGGGGGSGDNAEGEKVEEKEMHLSPSMPYSIPREH